MTSTFNLGLSLANTLHAFIVTLQADIHRDRIDSYLVKPESNAAFPNGQSRISSFLSFWQPCNTYSIPKSLLPAKATESVSRFFAYFPMYSNVRSVNRPDIASR
ncbi:hypothetical protein HanXRQr2_Chr17g0815881 [Helianthus annuus]|uniref:Uncharacterized protein n=1 Tax=Helianthus annuus TaxID=4232 RepID=A0A9K3GUT5_HELAN|nr:hypothetical protein HanXRQr2_Chr17g0815881 [Helianthus annuus]KAJ0814266.1 hypothetical protein HanPSC8_Chr17g0783611 [Helianthus annuus]